MADEFSASVRVFLKRITPERVDLVSQLTNGVTFRQDDNTEGIGFYASPNWKFVRVTMRCQARLWAHCFAYSCMFAEFVARSGSNADGNYERLSNEQLTTADQLLEWAVKSDVKAQNHGKSHFPVSIEQMPKCTPGSFHGVASDTARNISTSIFENALAFILYHELAHVHLGHKETEIDLSIKEEFEADAHAAKWLLERSDDEFTYIVRHLGVAVTLLWFVSTDFRIKYVPYSHPPSWRRLLAALSPTVKGDTDAIWGFVVLALSLHFHRHGLLLESIPNAGPTKPTVVEMIKAIEQFNSGLEAKDENPCL